MTAPNCLRRVNSQSWDGQILVWRDVLETLRGLSKKFGQDGQLETGSDDLKWLSHLAILSTIMVQSKNGSHNNSSYHVFLFLSRVFHEFAQMWISMFFFSWLLSGLVPSFRDLVALDRKISRLSFQLTNSRVRHKTDVEKRLSAERCRQLWSSILQDCRFMKCFQVWGWLQPSWWRVNLSRTSFNGNSSGKPQLICQCIKWCILYSNDLQRNQIGHLRWFLVGMDFFPVSKRKVAICQRTWTREQNWSPLIRQLHKSCY